MFETGDILYGRKKTAAIHPIVFIGEFDSDHFIGGMLTHSSRSENVAMESVHFQDVDENGEIYAFQYDNTFLVGKKLLKKNEWAPFTRVGKLTEIGMLFLIAKIGDQTPQLWEDYLDTM